MSKAKPTYEEIERRLAVAEPIVAALTRHEVDAVVGREKISFLLLREVGEALQSSEAAFRAMFDLTGVGMFQADTPALRFTRVNETFCRITGYSADELLTKTYLGLVHPDSRKRTMRGLSQVLRGKVDAWSADMRFVQKDDSVIWVGVNAVALHDENRRVIQIMAMVNDITAHKLAEETLRDRSAQLRKLATELTRAEQRERRRIAQILHNHIAKLLLGVKHRKAPLAATHEKTVRQALKDVQDFIDQSLATPPSQGNKPSGAKRRLLHMKRNTIGNPRVQERFS